MTAARLRDQRKPSHLASRKARHSAWLLLRQRDFRLYFIGSLVSNFGTWLQSTAQILIAYEVTSLRFYRRPDRGRPVRRHDPGQSVGRRRGRPGGTQDSAGCHTGRLCLHRMLDGLAVSQRSAGSAHPGSRRPGTRLRLRPGPPRADGIHPCPRGLRGHRERPQDECGFVQRRPSPGARIRRPRDHAGWTGSDFCPERTVLHHLHGVPPCHGRPPQVRKWECHCTVLRSTPQGCRSFAALT